MWTELIRPGMRCSAFKLNLTRFEWPERIFRIFVALILPVTSFLRITDLFLTYRGLQAGAMEANPVSWWVLHHLGFPGLVLLHVGLVAGAVLGVWLLYGLAINLRSLGEEGRTAFYILEAFLIVILLWLWFNLAAVVFHNYLVVFAG